VGERKDLSLLQGIRDREGEFYEAIAETGHQEHLKRAMEVVKVSMERIGAMESEKMATNLAGG
jgi:hypothetical protein